LSYVFQEAECKHDKLSFHEIEQQNGKQMKTKNLLSLSLIIIATISASGLHAEKHTKESFIPSPSAEQVTLKNKPHLKIDIQNCTSIDNVLVHTNGKKQSPEKRRLTTHGLVVNNNICTITIPTAKLKKFAKITLAIGRVKRDVFVKKDNGNHYVQTTKSDYYCNKKRTSCVDGEEIYTQEGVSETDEDDEVEE